MTLHRFTHSTPQIIFLHGCEEAKRLIEHIQNVAQKQKNSRSFMYMVIAQGMIECVAKFNSSLDVFFSPVTLEDPPPHQGITRHELHKKYEPMNMVLVPGSISLSRRDYKGLFKMLQVTDIHKRIPNLRFVIAGRCGSCRWAKEQSEHSDAVDVIGSPHEDSFQALINAADAIFPCLLPEYSQSRGSGSFGQAISNGVPMITSHQQSNFFDRELTGSGAVVTYSNLDITVSSSHSNLTSLSSDGVVAHETFVDALDALFSDNASQLHQNMITYRELKIQGVRSRWGQFLGEGRGA